MNYFVYYGLAIIALIITCLAQIFINMMYSKYKKVPITKNISGSEAAREILEKNGLEKIYVVETRGYLSDHYDPKRRVIRLSKDVYNLESISSVAIAAHECGHALQDKDNYTFFKIRSFLVPIVNVSSYFGYIAIVIGVILSMTNLIFLGIILESAMLIFQLVTLPVEINASHRGLEELKKLTIVDEVELPSAKLVLISAAMTYVASLASTFLELLRLVLIFADNKD